MKVKVRKYTWKAWDFLHLDDPEHTGFILTNRTVYGTIPRDLTPEELANIEDFASIPDIND